MRLSASSILRISLRSRSRVRSSRLNSSSWVARSFGSGKLAASSFMCVTVRSTSSMRSRFQLLQDLPEVLELLLAHVLLAALDDVGLYVARACEQAAGFRRRRLVGIAGWWRCGARRAPRAWRRLSACAAARRLGSQPAHLACGRRRRRGGAAWPAGRRRAAALRTCARHAGADAPPRACGPRRLACRRPAHAFLPLRASAQVSWPASVTPRQLPR